MSSSSEVFSDMSSYENHLQPPIKVNVRKKVMKQSLGLQNVREKSDIVSIANNNARKTVVLKPQSNTTSKISHALEVLKKFDNKYRIKTSGLSNLTKVVDNPNSSTNVSIKSKPTKSQDVEAASHQPNPKSEQTLDAIKSSPSYERDLSIGSISQDKISKNITKTKVPPEVVTVDESEDYESDFESSDSESLLDESDGAKDVDSSNESQPSARPKSSLAKPNLPSSETESSIHTIADHEPNSIENVGLFGNIRLFTFSDLGGETGRKIDELIVPVQLKDGSSKSRLNSSPRLIEKSIDESKNKFQRSLEIPIPTNIAEKVNTSLDKSSDYESIAESLTNSSDSDDSTVPFRRNIFTMDDVDSAVSDQPRDAPLIVHQKESVDVGEYRGNTQKKHNDAVVTGKLLNIVEDIEELNDGDSVKQSEERALTDDGSSNDSSYESDNFSSKSEVKSKKESSEESSRLSRKNKSCLVSDVQSSGHTRKQTHGKTIKRTVGIDKWNENLPTDQTCKEMSSAKGKGSRVTEVRSELHLATRDISVQTEFLEDVDVFSDNVLRETGRPKARPPRPVFEALNLSWDFDIESNLGKSAFFYQQQTFTPEIIEALANQNPAENALDQVLKQQISLTKHFMASQYKMYQTYCTSVKQLTSQYTPVTLEETKEFIRMHKKMRTNRNNQQVI